ncbi:MAG: DUF421 domain-containing protein [Bacillaceae bacterium]|nr:DUF421 domain-containing protein [Bacillaceae bacterium]
MQQFFSTTWESVLLLVSGILFLRLAGRKSISQMTLAQTVVMISIGSIIIQPIVETSIWRTLLATAVFVLTLVFLEWLQVKFNLFESFLSGKSKTVIDNGKPVAENLRKMRMSVDQLEVRLRQQGIQKISDVKTATIEHNGQLGYELMRHAKPLTVGEFEKWMASMAVQPPPPNAPQPNLFDEVKQKGHTEPNPPKLQ